MSSVAGLLKQEIQLPNRTGISQAPPISLFEFVEGIQLTQIAEISTVAVVAAPLVLASRTIPVKFSGRQSWFWRIDKTAIAGQVKISNVLGVCTVQLQYSLDSGATWTNDFTSGLTGVLTDYAWKTDRYTNDGISQLDAGITDFRLRLIMYTSNVLYTATCKDVVCNVLHWEN